MKREKWFALFLFCQIVILSFMGISWFVTGVQGREIRLQTELIDPNDVFYGDYLALSYNVNKVPITSWKGNGNVSCFLKRSVYVVLTPTKRFWEVKGVFSKKPRVLENEVVLKALLQTIHGKSVLDLTYGIERFYIQQHTGRKWQSMQGGLVAVLRVSPWGQVRIMRIEGE